jgi:hypothetical protein
LWNATAEVLRWQLYPSGFPSTRISAITIAGRMIIFDANIILGIRFHLNIGISVKGSVFREWILGFSMDNLSGKGTMLYHDVENISERQICQAFNASSKENSFYCFAYQCGHVGAQ